jgi:hypothetical protein
MSCTTIQLRRYGAWKRRFGVWAYGRIGWGGRIRGRGGLRVLIVGRCCLIGRESRRNSYSSGFRMIIFQTLTYLNPPLEDLVFCWWFGELTSRTTREWMWGY